MKQTRLSHVSVLCQFNYSSFEKHS